MFSPKRRTKKMDLKKSPTETTVYASVLQLEIGLSKTHFVIRRKQKKKHSPNFSVLR